MFKNTYQSGLLSIFYSVGSNPLSLWESSVQNGHIKRLTDEEVNSIVLEIVSTNVATTYIVCPKDKKYLGIKLPFLVMIIKNLKRYFSFEITILDDKNMRRRFRTSNYQSTTKIKPFCTSMPIGLSGGWNQIQFNLADFTRRAYGSQYVETLRVQVHANARIRRIYFSDRLYTEDQLPQDYKLYLPLKKKDAKSPKPESVEEKPPLAKAPEVTEPAATAAPALEVVMEPTEELKTPSAVKAPSQTSKTSVHSEAKPPSQKASVHSAAGVIEEAGTEAAEAGQAEAEGGAAEEVTGEAVGEEQPAGEEAPAVEEPPAVEDAPAAEEPSAPEEPPAGEPAVEESAAPEPAPEENLEEAAAEA